MNDPAVPDKRRRTTVSDLISKFNQPTDPEFLSPRSNTGIGTDASSRPRGASDNTHKLVLGNEKLEKMKEDWKKRLEKDHAEEQFLSARELVRKHEEMIEAAQPGDEFYSARRDSSTPYNLRFEPDFAEALDREQRNSENDFFKGFTEQDQISAIESASPRYSHRSNGAESQQQSRGMLSKKILREKARNQLRERIQSPNQNDGKSQFEQILDDLGSDEESGNQKYGDNSRFNHDWSSMERTYRSDGDEAEAVPVDRILEKGSESDESLVVDLKEVDPTVHPQEISRHSHAREEDLEPRVSKEEYLKDLENLSSINHDIMSKMGEMEAMVLGGGAEEDSGKQNQQSAGLVYIDDQQAGNSNEDNEEEEEESEESSEDDIIYPNRQSLDAALSAVTEEDERMKKVQAEESRNQKPDDAKRMGTIREVRETGFTEMTDAHGTLAGSAKGTLRGRIGSHQKDFSSPVEEVKECEPGTTGAGGAEAASRNVGDQRVEKEVREETHESRSDIEDDHEGETAKRLACGHTVDVPEIEGIDLQTKTMTQPRTEVEDIPSDLITKLDNQQQRSEDDLSLTMLDPTKTKSDGETADSGERPRIAALTEQGLKEHNDFLENQLAVNEVVDEISDIDPREEKDIRHEEPRNSLLNRKKDRGLDQGENKFMPLGVIDLEEDEKLFKAVDVLCISCYDCIPIDCVNEHSEHCPGLSGDGEKAYEATGFIETIYVDFDIEINDKIWKLIHSMKERKLNLPQGSSEFDLAQSLIDLASGIMNNNFDVQELQSSGQTLSTLSSSLLELGTADSLALMIFSRRLSQLAHDKLLELPKTQEVEFEKLNDFRNARLDKLHDIEKQTAQELIELEAWRQECDRLRRRVAEQTHEVLSEINSDVNSVVSRPMGLKSSAPSVSTVSLGFGIDLENDVARIADVEVDEAAVFTGSTNQETENQRRFFFSVCLKMKLSLPPQHPGKSIPVSSLYHKCLGMKVDIGHWHEFIQQEFATTRPK